MIDEPNDVQEKVIEAEVPDTVDRTQPWWVVLVDLAGPSVKETVKIESNNQLDLLPKSVDVNFEEYGDEDGRVQIRSDYVIKRTYMHVKPKEPTT